MHQTQLEIIKSPKKGIYTIADMGYQLINSNLDKRDGFQPSVSCMLQLTNSNRE